MPGVYEFPVHPHIEHAPAPFYQCGFDAKRLFNHAGQTGGLRIVVSFNTVFDGNIHTSPPFLNGWSRPVGPYPVPVYQGRLVMVVMIAAVITAHVFFRQFVGGFTLHAGGPEPGNQPARTSRSTPGTGQRVNRPPRRIDQFFKPMAAFRTFEFINRHGQPFPLNRLRQTIFPDFACITRTTC